MRSRDENTNITKGRPSPRLVLVKGKGERSYPITKEETTIGRSPDCDIVINDSSLSRQHARIVYLGGVFFIYDNESLNGTLVDGKKISESKIKDGSIVRVGDSEFKFEFGIEREGSSSYPSKDPSPRIKEAVFKNLGDKRIRMYAVAAVLLMIVLAVMFALKDNKRPKVDSPMAVKPSYTQNIADIPIDTKAMANVDTHAAARSYDMGLIAMMSGNLNQAISYFEQALKKQPLNTAASKKLDECRELLKKKIDETYDSGIREFNIMQYDRAILEWNKVALMAKGFDENMVKKANEKIVEAEKTKARLSNR